MHHTATDADGARASLIERDANGRVLAVERDGEATRFGPTTGPVNSSKARTGDKVTRWQFDPAGRLAKQTAVHDRAHLRPGRPTAVLDLLGRDRRAVRLRPSGPPHQRRAFRWSATGAVLVTDRVVGPGH